MASLASDPCCQRRISGIVRWDIAISFPLFEFLKLIQLCLPCGSMGMPNEADGVQLFNAIGCHGGCRVLVFEFLMLIALSLDPSGKLLIVLIGMRHTAVPMLELVLDELLEHSSPLTILIRPESHQHFLRTIIETYSLAFGLRGCPHV